jgi:heat shock protein HtpX
MFPPLWVDKLGPHIRGQYLTNWLLLLGLTALYVALPYIVAFSHGFLRGAGYVQGPVERSFFEEHWKIMLLSAAIAWGSLEVQGYMLRRRQASPFEHPELQALIANLAKKAGLSQTPALVFLEGPVNAAATHSLFFGRKVIVMGHILDLLKDAREQAAVFAHEIAHIRHGDIFALVLLHVGSRGLAFQKWTLAAALITAGGGAAVERGPGAMREVASEFVFLAVAYGIVWAIHKAFNYGEMAHSRGREYLADTGAVHIIGWENRGALISALIRIAHDATGYSPFRILRRTSNWRLLPHPPIADRARALDVPVPDVPDLTEQEERAERAGLPTS